jgi:hypothetical protein
MVLAGEVEVPVLLEVTVADYRAQGQDGFGALQAHLAPLMSRRPAMPAAPVLLAHSEAEQTKRSR